MTVRVTPREESDRPLTAKEVEILVRRRRVATLLGRCYTVGEIMELLGVSRDTVERDVKAVRIEFAEEMRDGGGVMDVWHRFQRQHLARVRELWQLVDRSKGVFEQKDGKTVTVVEPDPHIGLKALRELRAAAESEIKTAQSLGIVYKTPERRSIDLHLMDTLSSVPESEIDRLLAVPLDELPALLEQLVGPELAARTLGKPAPFPALPGVPEAEDATVEDVTAGETPSDHAGAERSPEGLDGSAAPAQVADANDPTDHADRQAVAPSVTPSPDPRPGGAPAMSWSVYYDGLEQFRKDEPKFPKQNFDAELATEVAAQEAAARAVVEAVVASGAIGGAGKDYVVALNGHANPGHEPREGWATDFINVAITQKLPQPVAAPADTQADANPSADTQAAP